MKKLFGASCAIFLVLTFIFSSCGELTNAFSNGPDFTKAADVENIESMIMAHITPEMEIMHIDFKKASSDGATFSSNKGIASICYVNPENPKKRIDLEVDLKDGTASINEFWKDREHVKKYSGVKNVTELGCARIAENVNTAIQMMEEQELKYSGIGSYMIDFNSKTGKYTHNFKIERRTGSGSNKIYYDEYRFSADAEGNVKASK